MSTQTILAEYAKYFWCLYKLQFNLKSANAQAKFYNTILFMTDYFWLISKQLSCASLISYPAVLGEWMPFNTKVNYNVFRRNIIVSTVPMAYVHNTKGVEYTSLLQEVIVWKVHTDNAYSVKFWWRNNFEDFGKLNAIHQYLAQPHSS